jgi:hypothetical protein
MPIALPLLRVSMDLMIRLDNISKQHGHQILFIDASMGLQKGEKAGLVGPNGAGRRPFSAPGHEPLQQRPPDGLEGARRSRPCTAEIETVFRR